MTVFCNVQSTWDGHAFPQFQAPVSLLAVEHSLKCFDPSDLATLRSTGRHDAFISAMPLDTSRHTFPAFSHLHRNMIRMIFEHNNTQCLVCVFCIGDYNIGYNYIYNWVQKLVKIVVKPITFGALRKSCETSTLLMPPFAPRVPHFLG